MQLYIYENNGLLEELLSNWSCCMCGFLPDTLLSLDKESTEEFILFSYDIRIRP